MDKDRVIDYLACLTDDEFAALAAARTSRRYRTLLNSGLEVGREVSPGTGGRRWEHVGAASPSRRRVIDPDTTEPTPA